MRSHSNKKTDSVLSLILMVLLVLSSLIILKHKRTISQFKKFETQVIEVDNWNSANFILRKQICGKPFKYKLGTNLNNDTIVKNNAIFLLFDYSYCEACFQSEMTRMKRFNSKNNIGLLTTPRNRRELDHLTKNDLGAATLFGIFNTKTFWTPEMGELLVYLKVVNGIATDLIIIDENYSSTINKWLNINTND